MSLAVRYSTGWDFTGWDFTGRSDAYLRETFDLWARLTPDPDWDPWFVGGMRAIVEECHARALKLGRARDVAAQRREAFERAHDI